jgi:DNA-binding NtrC family response regulator
MAETIRAALLQDDQTRLQPVLQHELRSRGVDVCLAANCAEVRALMDSANPPELVLTDLEFPDGTWEDVVRMSASAALPVNVIVVSRLADMRLYMEALQIGAFDFITPPFETPDISHVLRTASANARLRRDALPARPTPSRGQDIQPLLALAD